MPNQPADDALRRAGAVLTVDLGAIAANWRMLRDMGRGGGRPVDCAGVLKADAYGTGARHFAAVPELIAAAKAQVIAAQGSLQQTSGSVTAADVAAARATLEQARAKLATLQGAPSCTFRYKFAPR